MSKRLEMKRRPHSAGSPGSRAAADEPYRLTFEQAAIGIMHVDLDGRLLRVNKHICALTGYSEAELLSLPKFALVHPDDRREVANDFQRLASGHWSQYTGERRYLSKDGRCIPVWVSSTLAADRDPGSCWLVVIVEDISARKNAEEALRQSEERFRLAMKGRQRRPLGLADRRKHHLSLAALEIDARLRRGRDRGHPLLLGAAAGARHRGTPQKAHRLARVGREGDL